MNSAELQRSFYHLESQRYEMILPNVQMVAGFEMDLFCLRKSWYVEEIEVKISASDFRADFKKQVNVNRIESEIDLGRPYQNFRNISKHGALEAGRLISNYFSFLIPEELEIKITVPEYAGLYVVKNRDDRVNICCMKKPKILHRNKPKIETLYRLARALSYRYWSGQHDPV